MADIVERLRNTVQMDENVRWRMEREAADEIERLRKDVQWIGGTRSLIQYLKERTSEFQSKLDHAAEYYDLNIKR